MKRLIAKMQGVRRRNLVGLSALALMVATLVTAPLQSAYATEIGTICHFYTYESPGRVDVPSNGHTYWTTWTAVVPSNSSCHNINVRRILKVGNPNTLWCAWTRVHFFPSSGSDYANSWKWICPQPGSEATIATNVLNGTEYQIDIDLDAKPYGTAYD